MLLPGPGANRESSHVAITHKKSVVQICPLGAALVVLFIYYIKREVPERYILSILYPNVAQEEEEEEVLCSRLLIPSAHLYTYISVYTTYRRLSEYGVYYYKETFYEQTACKRPRDFSYATLPYLMNGTRIGLYYLHSLVGKIGCKCSFHILNNYYYRWRDRLCPLLPLWHFAASKRLAQNLPERDTALV